MARHLLAALVVLLTSLADGIAPHRATTVVVPPHSASAPPAAAARAAPATALAQESCPVNRSAWVPAMSCPAGLACCKDPAGYTPCTHGPSGTTPCVTHNGSWAPGEWGCQVGGSCCQSGVPLEESTTKKNCLMVGDSVAMGIYHNEMEAWGGCQTQLVVGLNAAMEKGCWNVTSLSQLHQNNLQVLVI